MPNPKKIIIDDRYFLSQNPVTSPQCDKCKNHPYSYRYCDEFPMTTELEEAIRKFENGETDESPWKHRTIDDNYWDDVAKCPYFRPRKRLVKRITIDGHTWKITI